jgi:hypothetical protein
MEEMKLYRRGVEEMNIESPGRQMGNSWRRLIGVAREEGGGAETSPMHARASPRIFARLRGSFAKLEKMGKEDAKLLERDFFRFAQKVKDGEGGWQTVGDALVIKNVNVILKVCLELCPPFLVF